MCGVGWAGVLVRVLVRVLVWAYKSSWRLRAADMSPVARAAVLSLAAMWLETCWQAWM